MPDFDQRSCGELAPVLLAQASLQLALGQPASARESLVYLLGRLRQAEVRAWEAPAVWLQGRALAALNRPSEAREALLEARALARATGGRRSLC